MKKVSFIIISIVVFVLLSACGAAPTVNNNTAKKTSYELAQLPLPSSTELIEAVKMEIFQVGEDAETDSALFDVGYGYVGGQRVYEK